MYRNICKMLAMLLLAVSPLTLFAQHPMLQQRMEIVEVEVGEDALPLQVFSLTIDGQEQYYLTVGSLGVGDRVIQVVADKISELFIPLGSTLAEAQASMEEMNALFDEPVDTRLEVAGSLDMFAPSDGQETVAVTHYRKLIGHKLEFSLERNGYFYATYVARSDFRALVRGVKFYRKLHPSKP